MIGVGFIVRAVRYGVPQKGEVVALLRNGRWLLRWENGDETAPAPERLAQYEVVKN